MRGGISPLAVHQNRTLEDGGIVPLHMLNPDRGCAEFVTLLQSRWGLCASAILQVAESLEGGSGWNTWGARGRQFKSARPDHS
jgi:hypothetical protein